MDIQTIAVVIAVLAFFIGSFVLIRKAEKELAKNIKQRAENPAVHQLNDLEKSLQKSKKPEKNRKNKEINKTNKT